MFAYDLDDKLIFKFKKIAKKNHLLYDMIFKKIKQITKNPQLCKPLKNRLKNKRRAHIGHFVLVYEIDEEISRIVFLDFDHHDNIYD
ncbi:MAG: type II toxin-antitoxin system RelE/ParE family toxin [Candidatus Aenigmarchaeota archaeon]|nr:type II toxin-antitoxin system RelE/ParE family toxin [Candidatus Aenigmarchaeota archaeon]